VALALVGFPTAGLHAQAGAPTITISPGNGEYAVGTVVPVTVTYCDNGGLNTSTRILKVNNVDVNVVTWPVTYTYETAGPCFHKGVQNVNVTIVAGTNTIRASIEDNTGLWSRWQTVTMTPPTPWAGVTVIPHNQFVDAAPSSAGVQGFTVTNIGDGSQTYTLAATNQGLPSIGTPQHSLGGSLTLASGASATVTVTTTSPATNMTSGRVLLTATGGGQSAAAFTEVTSRTPASLSNGVTLVNPSGTIDRGLCVSIAVGAAAAMECGDLRLTYALPAVSTKGKVRAPTLIYNAQHAHPVVAVPANLTIADPGVGEVFTAKFFVTSGLPSTTFFPAGSWVASDWGSGGTRRILATFDGSSLPTGLYRYRLDVQRNGAVVLSDSGTYLHVNRLNSPFNSGWWLAGWEQLVQYTSPSSSAPDTLMWVGGDGSARAYVETSNASCVFLHEALDRPDSIVGTPSGSTCVSRQRRTANALRVNFADGTGEHTTTVNRLGETTTFKKPASRLVEIELPSGNVARSYYFYYTGGGVLDSIVAPGTPSEVRATKFTSVTGALLGGTNHPRTTAIRGPDLKTVTFGYEGGSGAGVGDYRVVTRADRMSITTTFAYDASYRVATSSTPSSASQTVVQTLRAAEGQGVSGQALLADSVYTRLDGPRPGTQDTHKWWVNRLGAPTRTRNAVGAESRVEFDPVWPALPSTMVDAAGVVTRAYYTSRALVDSVVVVSPFGGGNAKSTFQWHPYWDMPTVAVDAAGVSTTRTYDASNGNLLTDRPGSNPARTTTFSYHPTTLQLATVLSPGIATADQLFYDGDLGNVQQTITARGATMTAYKDRIGRDTLVVSSADSVVGTTAKLVRQRIAYDSAGRVKETATSAPAMPYTLTTTSVDPTPVTAETTYVKTTYDAEGRPLTINAYSRPNFSAWDQCIDPVQECAGVPVGTEGSFDIRTYDWIGRPKTQRLGSGPASVTYDEAGNVVSEQTRNAHTITSTYDAANRLTRRIVPSVSYAQESCSDFHRGMLYASSPIFFCHMLFPLYPTPGGTAYVAAADTMRYVYDAAGRMVRADNRDARISRSYFPGGALKTDTLRTRSYGTSSFTATVFGQSYTYDVAGRRLSHVLPTNAGLDDGSITYAYDADRGYLSDVWHGVDHVRYTLDHAGRQDSMKVYKLVSGSEVLGVIERRQYDADGQMIALDRLRKDGGSYVNLLTNTLAYDARGKIRRANVSSASVDVHVQQTRNAYSGLGAVLASERTSQVGGWETEQFRTTALGEVYRSRSDVGSVASKHPVESHFGLKGQLVYKKPMLPAPDPFYFDTTWAKYDNAGNQIRAGSGFQRSTSTGDRFYTATRSYYRADHKVAAVQRYYATDAGGQGAWEEFRYDALGRRVLSRTRRGNNGSPTVGLCSGVCMGYVERTVWDGDQVLYELRVNGNDTQTAAQMDQLTSTGTSWGKAGYVHTMGIDKPVMTMDGRVPSYNWRGLPESSVWTDGSRADCSLPGTGGCLSVSWPSANSVYLKPPPAGSGSGGSTPQWIGTVLAGGVGSTGMAYRRNRLYDSMTGQFTQEDPIGLAGGLNLYGYAGGDPINRSDPFGLCSPTTDSIPVTVQCPDGSQETQYATTSQATAAEAAALQQALAGMSYAGPGVTSLLGMAAHGALVSSASGGFGKFNGTSTQGYPVVTAAGFGSDGYLYLRDDVATLVTAGKMKSMVPVPTGTSTMSVCTAIGHEGFHAIGLGEAMHPTIAVLQGGFRCR